MDFPTLEQLRNRKTMKWTRYPEDVLPLWVAESDFTTCPAITKALEQAVANETFGYKPDGTSVEQATAQFYNDAYGFAANPDWVFPIPDVVRGLYIAIEHFTAPDSPVVIPLPAYPPFFALLSATGREGIFIDARDGIDLSAVESAFAQGAGSIVLANPFNPLGYIFSAEFLNELTELAARYNARVLVDEIHAPLVFEGTHVVAAGLSETAAKVCITLTATSKAWNTAGLKCAQVIFSNEDDVRRWKQLSPVIKDGVSTIGLLAATAAYNEGREFLREELEYLRGNRDFLHEQLATRLPEVKFGEHTATYLMWLDFTAYDLPGGPHKFFLEHAKVAFNDGQWFGELGSGCVRLNFATSRGLLSQALDQMVESIRSYQVNK
ncbi:MAG: aminotransferase class I/II-fold pyridoxal phosphate-dependent enzyme [Corynebacterium sp.]|nr:aminotransferase class I/II-fold pyridoxal phosphate-dependent enzyme [Corynebacterium sp.]